MKPKRKEASVATVHPIAELFPMMEGRELDDFVKDIELNGQQEPIVYDQNGQLLDGRNRLVACERLGIIAKTRTVTTTDPAGYIISANLHRRHLTLGQRASIAARMANMPRGSLPGDLGDQPNGRSPRSNDDGVKLYTEAEASKKFDVSPMTIRRAKRVQREGTPEDIAAMDKGEKRVNTLISEIDQRVKEEGYRNAREKITKTVSAKKVLEKKLADQREKIGGTVYALNETADFLTQWEIESEHDPADIDRWIEEYSAVRTKISKFINRLKGAGGE